MVTNFFPVGPWGRGATYLVAASNAPAHVRAQADYICDGTADDVDINSALTAASTVGGKVLLSEGLFSITAKIVVPSTCALVGSGIDITIIRVASGNFHRIENSDTVGGNSKILLEDFTIDQNSTGSSHFGVRFDGVSDSRINRVKSINGSTTCTGIDVRTGSRVYVTDCVANSNSAHGIRFVAMTYGEIRGCETRLNGDRGILFESGTCSYCRVVDNIVVGNTGSGLEYSPTSGTSYGTVIANNVVESNGGNGIAAGTNTQFTSITGNTSTLNGTTTAHQGIITNGERQSIVGNTVRSNTGQGIDIGYASGCVISGNVIELNGAEGINIEGASTQADADECTVVGNVIINNGQTTGDVGINLKTLDVGTTVSNCVITGNRIDGHATGINLNDARVTDNLVMNNDVTNNTTPISDSGSSNIIRNNNGYVTENSGTGTINNGATTVVITHGCSITPTLDDISVSFGENPSNDPGNWWISTITSTQFTINVRNDPGASNLDVAWRVMAL